MESLLNVLTLLAITAVSFVYSNPVDTHEDSPIDISGSGKREVTLNQAINIVERARLTKCVARFICEVSCNPNAYGAKGQSLYGTLKRFESDSLPKLIYYKNARDKGLSLDKTKCKECFKVYANCKTPTQTLIRLADRLHIKA